MNGKLCKSVPWCVCRVEGTHIVYIILLARAYSSPLKTCQSYQHAITKKENFSEQNQQKYKNKLSAAAAAAAVGRKEVAESVLFTKSNFTMIFHEYSTAASRYVLMINNSELFHNLLCWKTIYTHANTPPSPSHQLMQRLTEVVSQQLVRSIQRWRVCEIRSKWKF